MANMGKLCPAISVIVPLYNAEKYVGECLDSLLAQTFQNFEVLMVDDCSSDNSVALVESYIPKFGGRLKLAHMVKNSGTPPLPRNKGFNISRGEYVFFMDNDDLLTPTALEELYALAENFTADVIYLTKNYQILPDRKMVLSINRNYSDKPTFESENLADRVKIIIKDKIWPAPWRKFVTRDLIAENEIFFPHIKRGDSDQIWTQGLLLYAKKFLCVPNPVYIQRLSKNSLSRNDKTPLESLNYCLWMVIVGLKSLNKFMNNIEFFKENPEYHYAVLEHLIQLGFKWLYSYALKTSSCDAYKSIQKDFKEYFGEHDVLISALCTFINAQQKVYSINQKKINRFAEQAQKRIFELEEQLKNK